MPSCSCAHKLPACPVDGQHKSWKYMVCRTAGGSSRNAPPLPVSCDLKSLAPLTRPQIWLGWGAWELVAMVNSQWATANYTMASSKCREDKLVQVLRVLVAITSTRDYTESSSASAWLKLEGVLRLEGMFNVINNSLQNSERQRALMNSDPGVPHPHHRPSMCEWFGMWITIFSVLILHGDWKIVLATNILIDTFYASTLQY